MAIECSEPKTTILIRNPTKHSTLHGVETILSASAKKYKALITDNQIIKNTILKVSKDSFIYSHLNDKDIKVQEQMVSAIQYSRFWDDQMYMDLCKGNMKTIGFLWATSSQSGSKQDS